MCVFCINLMKSCVISCWVRVVFFLDSIQTFIYLIDEHLNRRNENEGSLTKSCGSFCQVNGSRIKGWWRLHHFISTFTAGVLLIWPPNEPWYIFRSQFMWFNCYISKYDINDINILLQTEKQY